MTNKELKKKLNDIVKKVAKEINDAIENEWWSDVPELRGKLNAYLQVISFMKTPEEEPVNEGFKESEDERIKEAISYAIANSTHEDGILINGVTESEAITWLKKAIIPNYNDIDSSFIEDIKGVISDAPLLMQSDKEKMIAWLEKQGESKFEQCIQEGDKIVSNEDGTHFNVSQLERVSQKATDTKEAAKKFLKTAGIMDKNGELADEYRLEKQAEQKPVDFKAKDWYVSKVDGKIYNAKFMGKKQEEQKPAWSEEDEEKLNQLHKLNNLLDLESIVSKLRIKNICDNINEPQYRIGYNNALKDIKYEIDQIPLENKNDIELENNIELIKEHYSLLSHIKLSLIDIEHCARYFYKLGLKSQIKLLK